MLLTETSATSPRHSALTETSPECCADDGYIWYKVDCADESATLETVAALHGHDVEGLVAIAQEQLEMPNLDACCHLHCEGVSMVPIPAAAAPCPHGGEEEAPCHGEEEEAPCHGEEEEAPCHGEEEEAPCHGGEEEAPCHGEEEEAPCH